MTATAEPTEPSLIVEPPQDTLHRAVAALSPVTGIRPPAGVWVPTELLMEIFGEAAREWAQIFSGSGVSPVRPNEVAMAAQTDPVVKVAQVALEACEVPR